MTHLNWLIWGDFNNETIYKVQAGFLYKPQGMLQCPELVTGLPSWGLEKAVGHKKGEENTASEGLRPSVVSARLSTETPREGTLCMQASPLVETTVAVVHTDPGEVSTDLERQMENTSTVVPSAF